ESLPEGVARDRLDFVPRDAVVRVRQPVEGPAEAALGAGLIHGGHDLVNRRRSRRSILQGRVIRLGGYRQRPVEWVDRRIPELREDLVQIRPDAVRDRKST